MSMEKRLIVVLENAALESVKVGDKFELLNPDDHPHILKKNGRDSDSCRPDITHLCLLALFDSPLNRASLLQIYVHTTNNILIEFNPETRIPRTFKRFAGLMVQLLHKLSVKDESGRKLIKVIKNPLTDHLPSCAKKIAISSSFKEKKSCKELVPENEDPIVMVVEATLEQDLKVKYVDENYSLSNYPLTSAITCSMLCSTFEEAWNVL
ncbi:ribosomal RNA small subunit methyltransferase NEP1-like [Coccinella septempunctata]|uniref:ribosomal RNA small subunit methyltransferase NEP1-like n=1 Tax=Coccinella septempunctata TaxID=41139 RepID=UPI001D0654DF|nr:ribosomal RNA small subunit methyltransferase NEP1-like [Coccinella septempunctata]